MRQFLGRVLWALGLVCAFSGAGLAEGPDAAHQARTPAVSVVKAVKRELVEQITVTGTLVPRETVEAGADVEGLKILSLHAEEGDPVFEGSVLARLARDTIDIQLAQNEWQLMQAGAAIEQADSQILEAEALAKEAKTALERTRVLVTKGVMSQDVLDQRIAAESAAAARLRQARQGARVAAANFDLIKAQRDELSLRASKTEIIAPAGGLILARNARVGMIVSAQSGPLFTLAKDGLIELDAEVPETELGRIQDGQKAQITTADGMVVEGSVRLILPQVDQTTRLGRVRIALDAEKMPRAGSFARAVVEINRREGVTVPVSAILPQGDKAGLLVVKGDKVESRIVETGLSAGGFIEITAHLAEGENVVARAGALLRDGDTITPVEENLQEVKG